MEPHGGYPNAYVRIEYSKFIKCYILHRKKLSSFNFKDPFDCAADLCHLAWLIRDNRKLLKVIDGATCSNGTAFEQLDSDSFQNCPVKVFFFFFK
jgi:hypothetical protein